MFFYKFDVPNVYFSTYERAMIDVPHHSEILLYDFNWMTGDTISFPLKNQDSLLFRVAYTSEVNERKLIALYGINTFVHFQQMIEGIGDKTGLFGMYYNAQGSDYIPNRMCFYHDGELIQDEGPCNPCYLVSGVESESLIATKIYPNPAINEFRIETDASAGPFVLHVFNMTGQILYVDPAFNGNAILSAEVLNSHGLVQIQLTDMKGHSISKSILLL